MTKRMTKSVSVLMLTAMLAACGKASNSGASGSASLEGLPEPGDFSDKVELTLSGSFTRGKIEDDNWVQKQLEEKFNVKINNVKIDTWNKSESSLLVASNDLPDTFSFTGASRTPNDYYNDGVTRTIPREMIEKYAPNYAKMLDTVDGGLGWKLNQSPENPDEYTGLVSYAGNTEGLLWSGTLRLDWLEKLGYKIPEDAKPIGDSNGFERIYRTDKSYTIDEIEKILIDFVEKDPDGNGKKDTYGILPSNDNMNWGVTLLGAYGVGMGYNMMEDGELKTSVISNAYRQFLKKMADWNQKGLIDPEWPTLDTKATWEKYKEGKVGYSVAQRAYIAQEPWTEGRAPHNILGNDPNAKLLVINYEVGPEGKAGHVGYTPVTLLSGNEMLISAKVTDEQLARYLQLFDTIDYNPEEGLFTRYGTVGKDSDWAGKEGDSTIIMKEGVDLYEGQLGLWAYNQRTYYGKYATFLTMPKTLELMDQFYNKPENVEKYIIRPYRWDLFGETRDAELKESYGAQLDTIVSEFRINALTGKVDVDKEWDNYVKQYLSSGGEEVLKELEKAPKVSDILKEKSE